MDEILLDWYLLRYLSVPLALVFQPHGRSKFISVVRLSAES